VGIEVTDSTLRHPWGQLIEPRRVPIITIHSLPNGHVTPDGKIPPVSGKHVDECLGGLLPDVVFLPGWSFEICRRSLDWCRRHSVPAVVMSESKFDDESRFWFKERLKSWLYVRHFAAALVAGNVHADYAESLGIPRDRIFTGYDVVDNAHFERGADRARHNKMEVRRTFPCIPRRPYFIVVSRMVERKNILGLVKAYAQYLSRAGSREDSWDLVICGNGPQLSVIQHEAEKCQLNGHLHLPGFLPYADMPTWYGMASAFVHPALHEQWGLVVNEACASGLPVIVSRTVGSRYDLVAEGKNGFLIDPKSINDMAEKLVVLQNLEGEKLRRMGDCSRQMARKLTPTRFGEEVVKTVLSLRESKV
jgi:1,2-diacylglycerol 3-alpha-glucosyltransferase